VWDNFNQHFSDDRQKNVDTNFIVIIQAYQKIEIIIPPDQESKMIELEEGSEARIVIDGARKLRLDAVLSGEDSRLEIIGVFSGKKNKEQHVVLAVVQDAPRTICNVRLRSALDDSSCSRFDGLIRMTECAVDGSARLSYRGMLLSKQAHAMPTPRLEVLTKRVASASHEAAVGTIDPQQLFYLQSRGISCEEAKKLISEGFLR